MSLVIVLATNEEATETCYSIDLERNGEKYICRMYSSLHNSWTDWSKDGVLISQPDWADDLDMWGLYELYAGRIGEN